MIGTSSPEIDVITQDWVVVRFASDSGDGMQLTGDWFTSETATFGNDLSDAVDATGVGQEAVDPAALRRTIEVMR